MIPDRGTNFTRPTQPVHRHFMNDKKQDNNAARPCGYKTIEEAREADWKFSD